VSRTQKSALNVVGNTVLTAATVATGFLATPIVLNALGPERFGAFRVLRDWLGYFVLLEFGLGGALLARFAWALARNDREQVGHLAAAGLRSYAKVTAGMVVASAALLALLPHVVSSRSIGARELGASWAILMVTLLLTPAGVLRSLLAAHQRTYVVSFLGSLESVITAALMVATAWLGLGLPGQSLATLAAQSAATLLLIWYVLRTNPVQTHPARWLAAPDPTVTESVWRLNWSMFIHNVTLRVGLLSDHVIIGWTVGAAGVTQFFLTQRLASIAQGQLLGVGSATCAGLAELHAQGSHERFRARLTELTGTVSALSLALLAPMGAFNHRLVELWVGRAQFAGESLNILTCANVWLWSLSSLWGWALVGTGQIGRWLPYGLAFTAVNVAVSIVGARTLGLVGPALGSFVAFLLVSAWALPLVLKQTFQVSPRLLCRAALLPLLWGGPYAVCLWVLAKRPSVLSWPALLIELSVGILLGVGLWWVLTLDRKTRAVWRVRFAGIVDAQA
jgi:O-antigen/teichoic acid export membrane protein